MNPKMSKIKGSNSNELRQKSGSGKEYSIYHDEYIPNSFNGKLCEHNNNYWLCQQCEIRIRNQDIFDRINYIMENRYTNTNNYYELNQDNVITLKVDFLASTQLENLLKEIGSFFFAGNDTFMTEGYM